MKRYLGLAALMLIFVCSAYSQDTIAVRSDTVELRGTPSSDGRVVVTMRKDDKGEVITRRGPWLLVQTPDHVGWLHDKDLIIRPTGGSDGIGTGGGMGVGSGQGRGDGSGVGSGQGSGTGTGTATPAGDQKTTPLKLLTRPKPQYTETARKNLVEGQVVLRITFLANGTIGPISVVKGLPDGLTEQAIEAAKRITFEPMRVNGKAKTTTKVVTSSFSVY